MLYVYDSLNNEESNSAKLSHKDLVQDVIFSVIEMDGNKKFFSASQIINEERNIVYRNAVLEVLGFAESFNGNLVIFTSVGPIEYIINGWDNYYSEVMSSTEV